VVLNFIFFEIEIEIDGEVKFLEFDWVNYEFSMWKSF
jgi:hypothetical protein